MKMKSSKSFVYYFNVLLISSAASVAAASRDGKVSNKHNQRVTVGHNNLDAGIQPIKTEQLISGSDGDKQQKRVKVGRKHLILTTLEVPPFMISRRVSNLAPASGQIFDSDLAQHSEYVVGNNNKSFKTIVERTNRNQSQEQQQQQRIEWFGYCVDFFEELIKYLPYEVTYELYRVPDGKFGSKAKEIILDKDVRTGKIIGRRQVEKWTGIVGELEQKRADIALAPLAVMAERELVVDFTVPFYDLVGIQILLKKPEVPKDWFKFLTVLDSDVWLSILIAYFITSFVIYLFDRLSPYSNKNAEKIKQLRQKSRKNQQQRSTIFDQSLLNKKQVGLQLNSLATSKQLLSAAHESPMKFKLNSTDTPESSNNNNNQLATLSNNENKEGRGGGGSLSTRWRRLSQDYIQSIGWQVATNRESTHRQNNHSGIFTSTTALVDDNNNNKLSMKEESEIATSDEDDEDHDSQRPKFNFRDSLWFCITSLTPQGGGEAPQNLSGRIVAGAWWLFCFIVTASYTANLAAFLTVSRLDIPIESLDDLAKQYRIKYAPIDGTAEQTYFERMAYIEEIFYNIWKEMSLNDSLSEEERSKFAVWDYPISDKYTKIWAQIQEVGMPLDVAEAIGWVKNSTLDDGFALLADANLIKFALMTDCSFKAVGDEFSRKPIALGVAKGQEQLRDDISYAILKLINQRFMEILREKWWTNNEARVVCGDATDESSEGMSIENIGGVFIIILTGVLFSFIVWAIERFVYKTKIKVSRNLIMSNLPTTTKESLSSQ